MSEFTVGIVGCGLISEAHLRAWAATPGFKVTGVIDTNREQAEKRASQFGVPTIFDSLDPMIAACDIIDVCTPPASHAAIAEQAIAAKRHLVMEKPVVTKLEDWERIAPKARAAGTKIAVIHNVKYLHSVQVAKRWVTEGKIGEVIRVQREFLTHPDHDRMLVGDKHWSHALPGGRWFETLPHELYLTHWFAGPLELSAVTAISTGNAPSGAPADEVLITLAGKRAIASFHFSAHCEENRRTLMIQGTKGRITVDLLSDFASISTLVDSKLRRVISRPLVEAGATLLRAAPDRGRYGMQKLRKESPHLKIIQALGRHLRDNDVEPTPLDEVDYVIRNCDLIGREIDRQVKRGSAAT
jgi:predicted dehydrogenase